ncbi:MAG: hypothetical protein IJT59_04170, partial [Desulfovibrionaceae bacterium]|nr:hypothetical protein [Desulfovibrionaceae bacterium]
LPDQDEALLLNPQEPKDPNPNLAKQMEPIRNSTGQIIRNIERNATSGKIFTTLKELEKGKSDTAKIFMPLVEQTRCTDVVLLKEIYSPITGNITSALNSIYKNGAYAHDLKHYYEDIFTIGKSIMYVAGKFPEYSSNDISNLYADVFIATHTDEQLAKILEGLQSEESQLALNVLFNHANKESLARKATPNDKLDQTFSALSVLEQIQSKIAQKLQRPAPDSIFKNFDPNKTIRDLPLQDQLNTVLPEQFTRHLSNFDVKIFMAKDRLNDADYNQLKNFVSNLRLPDGKKVGTGMNNSEFTTTYTNKLGETEEDTWNLNNFSSIFAYNARKVSNLLKETNGQPTAAQLWDAVHGGQPPSNLTMNNFAETLMHRMTQEVHDYLNLIGLNLGINDFIHLCDTSVGIPIGTIIDKLSHANEEDVTFTMQDQVMETGLFGAGSGAEYADGYQIYGFGNDFYRTQMPLGARNISDEGCKITVVVNGKEQVFTQTEYEASNEAHGINPHSNVTIDHPYMKKLVGT